MRSLLAVSLLVNVAASSIAAAQCDRPLAGGIIAYGAVRDRQTGKPLVGARVLAGSASEVVTNADGCFAASGGFSGECPPQAIDCPLSVGVSADGYVGQFQSGYFPPMYAPFRFDVDLAPAAAVECRGDCDGNGRVVVAELVCGVVAALSDGTGGCRCADGDGNARVDVAELTAAVRNGLYGCVG